MARRARTHLWIAADGPARACVTVTLSLSAGRAVRLRRWWPFARARRLLARLGRDALVVELGRPGRGPTLALRRERDALIPNLGAGVGGDADVAWARPLSPFRRATAAERRRYAAG
ncbi:MAG: hypothetical protein H6713_00960 [Myxococcales bacterium]|nr:hypothetical protein [Myxococcales bacterium]